MLKINFFRRTDCHFPAISDPISGPKLTDENPALNVNFSILDPVLGSVLRPVLGCILGPESKYLLKVRLYWSPVEIL